MEKPLGIYACYRKLKGSIGSDLEFWTYNKKLYDAYVNQFASVLLTDKFEHHRLSIRNWDDFRFSVPDAELTVFGLDEPYSENSSGPFISTQSDLELAEPTEVLAEFLCMPILNFHHLHQLPKWIQFAMKKSKYWALMTDEYVDKLEWGVMEDFLEVDFNKLLFLWLYLHYSGEELSDITELPGMTAW